MTSEIRVNKIANRAGLSTVQYTDTGIIVSGIVTCTEISGLNALNIAGVSTFASPLDINGDIDVDGHTNLDNLSVAGVSTFTGAVNTTNVVVGDFLNVGSNIKLGNAGVITATSYRGDGSQLTGVTSVGGNTGVDFNDNIKVRLGTGNDLEIYYDGTDGWIKNVGKLKLESTNDEIQLRADIIYLRNKAANQNYFYGVNNAFVGLTYAGDMRLETESTGIKFRKRLDPETDSTVDLGTNAKRWRNIYADTYYGDGANLTNLPAGAPVGGASTNTVFFENDKEVAVNYQITSTKNAMTAGPIAINAGIAVTVPSGCAWTIV